MFVTGWCEGGVLHEEGDKVAGESVCAWASAGFVQEFALPPAVGFGVGDGDDVACGEAEFVRVGGLVVVQRLYVEQDRLACVAVLPRRRMLLLLLGGRSGCGRRCGCGGGCGRWTRRSSPLLLLLHVRRLLTTHDTRRTSMTAIRATTARLLLLLLLLQVLLHVR